MEIVMLISVFVSPVIVLENSLKPKLCAFGSCILLNCLCGLSKRNAVVEISCRLSVTLKFLVTGNRELCNCCLFVTCCIPYFCVFCQTRYHKCLIHILPICTIQAAMKHQLSALCVLHILVCLLLRSRAFENHHCQHSSLTDAGVPLHANSDCHLP